MSEQNQIRFDDGAAYETYMGIWSRKVGEEFLAWLKPPRDISWLDVGCGNGAFTALLAERVEPLSIIGVDPSPAQLDFARTRPGVSVARFEAGHANGDQPPTSGPVLMLVHDWLGRQRGRRSRSG